MVKLTRRKFIKSSSLFGIALTTSQWGCQNFNPLGTQNPNPHKDSFIPFDRDGHSLWKQKPGVAFERRDGLSKVTGQKVYGRDFHAWDMPGWPTREREVFCLRSTRAGQRFKALRADQIPKEFAPTQITSSEHFSAHHISIPTFFGKRDYLSRGERVEYNGQPIALLSFEHAAHQRRFSDWIFDEDNRDRVLLHHPEKTYMDPSSFGGGRLIRYEQGGVELYSQLKVGHTLEPLSKESVDQSLWGKKIKGELAQTKGGRLFERTYQTQICDPLFMEPEAGIAFFDTRKGKLHLVVSTQSPAKDLKDIATLFKNTPQNLKPKEILLTTCYPGGGFGGRDHSLFPVHLALSAYFNGNTPVRMNQNRYQQFQTGIKRHQAHMDLKLALTAEGRFHIFTNHMVLNGGGRANFSKIVAQVAAQNATNAYYIPKLDISSEAQKTIDVTAGSMRGFGTQQSIFALETLLDEMAYELKMDPLQLRTKNLLTKNNKTATGTIPNSSIQSQAIMEKVRRDPLWTNREKIKDKTKKDPTYFHGVGFALAMKSFGTNRDGVLAGLELDEKGKLTLTTNAVDMGNGSATTLSVLTHSWLGQNVTHLHMGEVKAFSPLKLKDSFISGQAEQDKASADPHWTPTANMSSAASVAAYMQRHVVLQASELLFKEGIWPAAQALLQKKMPAPTSSPQWSKGNLIVNNRPIPFKKIWGKMKELKLVSGVQLHGFYRAEWAKASFPLPQTGVQELPIDGLAFKKATEKDYRVLVRSKTKMPPFKNDLMGVDLYTPCASLVAIKVHKKTFETKITEVKNYIDCGPPISSEIVLGQMEGALAMGIGHALYEELSPGLEGPGKGDVNLDEYHVPTYADVPVEKQEHVLLPPAKPTDPPKGMAEVALIPVIPAIGNAIFHATGARVRSLPITPQKIREQLKIQEAQYAQS